MKTSTQRLKVAKAQISDLVPMEFQATVEIEIVQLKDGKYHFMIDLDGFAMHEVDHGEKTPMAALAEAAKYLSRKCRKCGCTLLEGCEGKCHWVLPDLCSECVNPKKGAKP